MKSVKVAATKKMATALVRTLMMAAIEENPNEILVCYPKHKSAKLMTVWIRHLPAIGFEVLSQTLAQQKRGGARWHYQGQSTLDAAKAFVDAVGARNALYVAVGRIRSIKNEPLP